mmetsp:Transcript_23426/g.60979  ORF Transcript_23426/g.60979 Transcript_23426/m.60979 type:complete len:256 (-) Transcript_23426:753-1520(-)
MLLNSKAVPLNEGGRENLPVTECGIRVSWLILWAKIVEQKLGPDVTTAEVCAKFVIPSTSQEKCRYVDIMEPENVGAPQYFLSHTWSLRFLTLMEIVGHRLQNEPESFVWLDIFAINQNKYEDKGELQADDISHLASVVRKAKSTLFCLDEEGRTLTRIWWSESKTEEVERAAMEIPMTVKRLLMAKIPGTVTRLTKAKRQKTAKRPPRAKGPATAKRPSLIPPTLEDRGTVPCHKMMAMVLQMMTMAVKIHQCK